MAAPTQTPPKSENQRQAGSTFVSGSRGTVELEAKTPPESSDTPRRLVRSNNKNCASSTRGTGSADVITTPELSDHPRGSLTKNPKKSPAIAPGSRGPVGADAIPTPELTITPRRRKETGRGSHKGGNTHPPVDDEGRKDSSSIGTDKGNSAHSPKDFAGTKKVAASLEDASNSKVQSNNTNSPSVGTSLPWVGGTPPPALGGALSHSAYVTDCSTDLTDHDSSSIFNIDPPDDHSGSLHRSHTGSTASNSPYPTPALPKSANFILQWNVNGFLQRIGDLELLCQADPPWVIALQEVNKASVEQMNRSLGGRYSWIKKGGRNFRHSVAIGVLNTVPFRVIDLDSQLPILGVQLTEPVNITVACVYLPCGRIGNLNCQLSETLVKLPEPRILVGDVNAHHSNWGCPRSDLRGTDLVDIFEKEDMVILNDGAPTYFNGRYTSAIDVTAASRHIAGKTQWNVNSDLYGSDHYPIQIQLSATFVPAVTRRPRWRYEQADWESYGATVETLLLQRNPDSIEDLSDAIYEAATATIPKTSSVPGRKALRWWNEDTKKAVKARRKALRRVKRLPIGHHDREEALCYYRELHNQCRQEIRDAKRSSWMEFLEGMNASQSSADLWQRINALSGKRRTTPLHVQVNGSTVSDPETVADELGTYFAELATIDKYDNKFKQKTKPSTASIADFIVPPDTASTGINQAFSWQELQHALRCSNGKSAGPDEIGYPLLKRLPVPGQLRMLDLFNKLWLTNGYPAVWKESLVVPIPKAGVATREVSKFRPIALTCCMAKVLERMVNRRLKQHLEAGNFLDHRQHAFRQGFGTSTYFATLGEVLKNAYDSGLHTEIVSLDISKAFNRTWTPLVLKQLIDWGLNGPIVHFIQNFLSNRSFRVAVGNTKSRLFPEETGVPQGSVIAVTLFLVAMNGVFRQLPKNIYVFVYADDILIVTTGPTPVRTRMRAQAAVSAVARWAHSVGFELSAPKSIRCHVCPSRHRISGPPIKIDDQSIPLKKTVRVLGVLVDRFLNFEQHFSAVKKNCRSRVNLIRTISRQNRSNNRSIRFHVASAIIDSRLLYGLEMTCIATDKLLATLAPVYNTYVRIVSGLLPSTPADAACIDAGILPFRFRITAAIATKAAAFISKTSGNQGIFLLDEGNRLLRTAANEDLPPVARVHWHGDKCWQTPLPKIESRIKDRFKAGDNSVAMKRTVAEMLGEKYPTHTHRYTDGSRSRAGVGIGLAGNITPTSCSLPPQCSVFSAEAAAIFIAATTLSDRPILVLTDSHSVIQALTSEAPTHPWVQATMKSAPPNTVFCWVPGHCGIPGNSEADFLAGAGPSAPRYTNEVPLHDVKRWIVSKVREAWDVEWAQNRSLFIRRIKGTTRKWTEPLNQRDQKIASRLRTGHTKISHNFGGTPFHRTCVGCRTPASIEHILCVCPQYQNLRELHGLPNSIRDMLGDDPSTLAAVMRFLKDAGLYFNV